MGETIQTSVLEAEEDWKEQINASLAIAGDNIQALHGELYELNLTNAATVANLEQRTRSQKTVLRSAIGKILHILCAISLYLPLYLHAFNILTRAIT